MWITIIHVLEVPGAVLIGYGLGRAARKGRFSRWQALLYALIPGLLIALVSALLHAAPPRNQKPWQGLLLWAAWSGFGVIQGWRGDRRPKQLTTMNLSGKETQGTL